MTVNVGSSGNNHVTSNVLAAPFLFSIGFALVVIVILILCVKRRKRRGSNRTGDQHLTVNEELPSTREVVESEAYASFANHQNVELPSDEEEHCYATITKTEQDGLLDHQSEAGGYEMIEFTRSDGQNKLISQSDDDPYASIDINPVTDQSDQLDNIMNQSETSEPQAASPTIDIEDDACPYSTVDVKLPSAQPSNQNEDAGEAVEFPQSDEAVAYATLQVTSKLRQTIRKDTAPICNHTEANNNTSVSKKAQENESEEKAKFDNVRHPEVIETRKGIEMTSVETM